MLTVTNSHYTNNQNYLSMNQNLDNEKFKNEKILIIYRCVTIFSIFKGKNLKKIIFVFLILLSLTHYSFGDKNHFNKINGKLDFYLNNIINNFDINKGYHLYHTENTLLFLDLYCSKYDKTCSSKIDNFLYKIYLKKKIFIYKEIQIPTQRLNILQFLYLFSQNIKNNLSNNQFLNSKILSEYRIIYIYLQDILLSLWYKFPAWHWVFNFNNMYDRMLAKVNKSNPKLLKRKYYTAFMDEDGFACSIVSDLIYINHKFRKKLSLETNSSELMKLKEIRNLCVKFIKQKSKIKNNFHFGVGDLADRQEYAYAGCDTLKYPTKKCVVKGIEEDTSHFSRFPWWITSVRDSYDINSSNYTYFNNWLKSFSIHFLKKILVKKGKIYLLNNFINGKNGWFRVGYHPKIKNFGYPPYSLSLISALGSYYTLAKYNPKLCNYIEASSYLFESNNSPYKHYFDEKYPTSYTKFLKDVHIYKKRFTFYNLLAMMAWEMYCKK